MATKYYDGNAVDTTSKDLLSNSILVKTTKQEIDSKIFEGIFGIFTRAMLETGKQWEEIEVANLTSADFDPNGTNPLTKKDMSFASLYHKINRRKTFQATVSDAQVKMSMLSKENMASLASAIVNELYNSSAIEDYEAMKDLLADIAMEQKKITICDMNGSGADMDALTKAIQTLATNMTLPSTHYNFSGFKKAFNKKEDLVLIIDSATQAKINVDSLASAFNMAKKDLVSNIIVVDSLPEIKYTAEKANKEIELDIGEANKIAVYKPNATGTGVVSGSAIAFLVERKAIIRDPVERELTEQYNGKGRFTNYYYHATDVLSYSTLKNAIVFVD